MRASYSVFTEVQMFCHYGKQYGVRSSVYTHNYHELQLSQSWVYVEMMEGYFHTSMPLLPYSQQLKKCNECNQVHTNYTYILLIFFLVHRVIYENLSSMNKNEIMKLIGKQMKMLNKITQTQKDKMCMLSYEDTRFKFIQFYICYIYIYQTIYIMNV